MDALAHKRMKKKYFIELYDQSSADSLSILLRCLKFQRMTRWQLLIQFNSDFTEGTDYCLWTKMYNFQRNKSNRFKVVSIHVPLWLTNKLLNPVLKGLQEQNFVYILYSELSGFNYEFLRLAYVLCLACFAGKQ